jgi:alpha-glucosidase
VDGFRLDVVNWFIKDDLFRDNPFTPSTRPRPYDLQKHIYDRNRPETHGIVREFRALLDRYPGTMSVGEVFDEKPGRHALSASYLGNGTDELHLAFDFSLIHERWNASRFLRMIEGQYGRSGKRLAVFRVFEP